MTRVSDFFLQRIKFKKKNILGGGREGGGLDFITTNILTKFHEDWIKTMPSREYTCFF